MKSHGNYNLNSKKVKLPEYATSSGEIPEEFGKYLKIHLRVLHRWDQKSRIYTNGSLVYRSEWETVVFLKDLQVYVKWSRTNGFRVEDEILVGKPVLEGREWVISVHPPSEELLSRISENWDAEKKRFRNSVFLKKDGNMVWVYLKELEICVGWKAGKGGVLFGKNQRKANDKNYFDWDYFRRAWELRRKISNSYGCW